MSKQDIEKRLGFAAQGVKETTRTSAKAEFVRFIDLETWKDSKGTVFTAGIEDDAGRFQPYVTARDSSGGDQLQTRSAPTFKTEKGARKWLNTWMQNHKSTSSRPGVKAKFATEVGRKGNKSAMISRDATGTWYAYVVQRIETGIGKDEDMLGTMRAYSTEDRAKRAAIKALDTSGFSRPTVKAKA